MEYILSFVWVCMESLFIILFAKAFLPESRPPKLQLLAYLVSVLALFIVVSFCSNLILRQILSLILYLGLYLYWFKGSLLARVLICAVAVAFAGVAATAISYGFCALIGISYEVLIWRKLSYVVVVSIGKLLPLLLAWLLLQFRKKGFMQIVKPKWLLLTLTFPVVSLLMMFVIFFSYQDREDLSLGAFIFSIGLAIANIAILYLIQRLEAQAAEEQEISLLNQQMAIQTESIVALEQSYRAQRKATHDFNNHLQTIQRLLENNDRQALNEYLSSLQKTQSTRILYMNSHHSIIDAVINQKCQVAIDADIDVQVQVNDLSGVTIKTDLLVVLLSNLMDNAIEACLRMDGDRYIQCKFTLSRSGFFLSVRNSSLPVVIVNNTIETSKVPKKDHGYGLNNIRRILSHLQAEYNYYYKDGYFHFIAEIPH